MGRFVGQWEASLDGWMAATPPGQQETLRDEFDGVPRPDRFPADAGVIASEDGRIRVLLHAPGREVPAPVDPSPSKPREPPRLRGGGRAIVFDVFEPGGRYLGRVRGPDGLQTHPYPVFGTDQVWAVLEDDLGVQQVVRLGLVEGARARKVHLR